MKFDNIQTKLYKKLLNKAKELFHLNKQVNKNSQVKLKTFPLDINIFRKLK